MGCVLSQPSGMVNLVRRTKFTIHEPPSTHEPRFPIIQRRADQRGSERTVQFTITQ